MKRGSLPAILCATTILVAAPSIWAAPAANPATVQPVEAKDAFTKALTEGKVLLDARYRYEYVDQDGLANNANAHTVRTRLGYETGKFHGFSGLIEFENITDLGGESYNNTINGKTTYPTVADPEDTNTNRLQLSYTGVPQTEIILGRQKINLDNERFVGSSKWRQNDQTYDAISIKNQSLKDTTLYYAFSDQVNRIFGTDSPVGTWDNTHIHMLNASYAGLSCGKITGYSYLLDIPDSKSLSSATYGARFDGKHKFQENLTGLFNLEYAHQDDYGNNPLSFNFDYYSIEPAITYGQWTVKAQYESIEGNGKSAMQFPLATLHAFNGWGDKFLTTPVNGLVDANLGITYVAKSENPYLNGTKGVLVYHDFSSERGSTDYGTEWDASVEQTFKKYYTAGIQIGYYNADKLYTDTTKIMPYFQVKF